MKRIFPILLTVFLFAACTGTPAPSLQLPAKEVETDEPNVMQMFIADLDNDGVYEEYYNLVSVTGVVSLPISGYNPVTDTSYSHTSYLPDLYQFVVEEETLYAVKRTGWAGDICAPDEYDLYYPLLDDKNNSFIFKRRPNMDFSAGGISPQLLLVLLIAALVMSTTAVVLCIILLVRRPAKPGYVSETERRLAEEIRATRRELNQNVTEAVKDAALTQAETQKTLAERQDARLKELSTQLTQSQTALRQDVNTNLTALSDRFGKFALQNDQRLESIRKTMEERVTAMQAGNEKKLEEMRVTVDEKLQNTLNERLKQSFSLVNESLDKVQRGLGEMQTIATGVGDLKKVLSNVKTRGILGEIQLGAILEEILAPEQYAANVATVKGKAERVEYAVKLPGEGDGDTVWLPIDAKFPSDAYVALLDAYEAGDAAAVETTGKVLENRIRQFAKDIHEKYIHVPETTEFGIMFLPVEGLYAEVVRRGMVEKLQNEFKINIAGPTTMAALLNSLQMGFRTLAIQKRSGEVWKVLGDVKTEFGKFGEVLTKTKRHLELASKDIDELVGRRTNQIQRKLRDVTTVGTVNEDDTDPFYIEDGDEG